MQNQFVNKNDMSNINSYRQIVFNSISSNFQRSIFSRLWQFSQFNFEIDYDNQNQSYRANSSQYSYIDYRNQQKLKNVEYQNYRQSTLSSSSIEQKQIANSSSSSQNDQRNAYDSSSNVKKSNSYRVDYRNQNQQSDYFVSQQRVFQSNVNVDNRDWRFYQSITNIYVDDEITKQKNNYDIIDESHKNEQNLNDKYYDEKTWNQIDDQNQNNSNDVIINHVDIFFIEQSISQLNYVQYICRNCEKKIYFNNKLHKHVRAYYINDNLIVNHVTKKSIDKLINKLVNRSINKLIAFDLNSLFVIRFIVSF